MNQNSVKSVFVSSTYSDLKDLRSKVAEKIHGLFYSVIQMENFPATGSSPLENSLRQLEKGCNYYILILGNRYGTIPSGKDISITHAEYRKALEMKKKGLIEDIFVFMSSDDVMISPKHIESDFLREKARIFRKEIVQNGNTHRTFSSEDSLFQSIYETFFHASNPNLELDSVNVIFSDFEQIKYIIEKNLESKSARIDLTLEKISKAFSPLFNLETDSKPDINQPILSKIREILEESIPHVAFDSSLNGRIERWGIRHVIFRVETAVMLMSAIKDSNLLLSIGEQIGSAAANDLFERVIHNQKNKNYIPESIEAFIGLFDYWDSSGGWGEIYFREEVNESETIGRWTIVARNNFLIQDREKPYKLKSDINHLYNFWKGYIKGALNVALLRLSEIYSSLSPEMKRKVIFPPYRRIISVERDVDENDIEVDLFQVTFEKHTFGWAFEILSDSRRKANNMTDRLTGKIIVTTELSAILSRLKSDNIELYSNAINSLNEMEQTAINNIMNHKHQKIEYDVHKCIEIVNSVLQQFVRN